MIYKYIFQEETKSFRREENNLWLSLGKKPLPSLLDFKMPKLLKKGARPKRRDIQFHDTDHEVTNSDLPLDQYNVISDNIVADHLINHIDRQPDFTKLRGGWKDLQEMYRAATTNRLSKRIIDNCGWRRLFKIDVPNSDKRLVEGLFERWWDTTHTFHLPHLEIGFTPLDFTFLSGIPIGKGDPPPFDNELFSDYELTMASYFPNMIECLEERRQCYRAGGIAISDLKSYVLNSKERQTDGEEEEIARAFLMWVVGQVFFGKASSVVSIGWLAAFEDLSQVHTYDWGSAILARIYKSLDECCRCSPAFSGMWMLLEFWFYTYFHACAPILDISSGSMDQWPVICAYNKNRRSRQQIDTRKHSIHIVREQIELRTPAATIWNPYSESQYAIEADIVVSRQLSSHRVILFDPESDAGFWYLGDRCWRQIDGNIAVPSNPPIRESLSNIPRWKFDLKRGVGWVPAKTYVVWVNEAKYKRYWCHVSRGAGLPLVRRDGNNEEIAGAASHDSSFHLPYPPVHSPNMFAYPTQGDPVDSSIYCDWNIQVAGSSGEQLTIPISSRSETTVFAPDKHTTGQWAAISAQLYDLNHQMRITTFAQTAQREREILARDREILTRDREILARDREILSRDQEIARLRQAMEVRTVSRSSDQMGEREI